jgi:hypothetical protein
VVQLLSFPGCPNVENARRALLAAFSALGREPLFEEVDTTDPNTPVELRAWGSPTILVNGVDVAGGTPAGRSCRLYAGGTPPVESIVAMLRESP